MNIDEARLKLRPFAAACYKKLFRQTRLNIKDTFPAFAANGLGITYRQSASLMIKAINDSIPLLAELARASGRPCKKQIPIEDLPYSPSEREAASQLKVLFDKYASDKSTFHNYEHLYGKVLVNRNEVKKILEIGLGSNNPSLPSNMGVNGSPGASLRAFRDFLPNAEVYGADIDESILFKEDRITTFSVDQTSKKALDRLGEQVGSDLDLIIDDGLHALDANLSALIFALNRIKLGGWIVVEDIGEPTIPAWELISALTPESYEKFLLQAKPPGIFIFSLRRIS